mgnify:FL=1
MKPILALSLGCPSSIGPEVAVRAALDARACLPVLVGDPRLVRRELERLGVDAPLALVSSTAEARAASGALRVHAESPRLRGRLPPYGRPDQAAGVAQLAFVDHALELVVRGFAAALVTAPVSKSVIASSGAPGAASFRGHTEHLAAKLGADEVVMAFWSRRLVTSLVTTHLPLARVPGAIDARGVARATYWLAHLLHELGLDRPRVAIAALNPHAGEGGLLGEEELTTIGPGIELARERLAVRGLEAELSGPLGAESAFRIANERGFDGVVAMYHDQATIPSKLLAFGDAVNVTLGLPIIRTSVDHGTAYDRAGSGEADASGMRRAIELATRLARARAQRVRESSQSVTGPSLSTTTRMSAPKRPVATMTPSARTRSTKRSK